MYLVAFGVAYLLFGRLAKERKTGWDKDLISGFFLAAILGLILGARLFGTLVYDASGEYWRKPWLIFWPFSSGGTFIGFRGMSFHGGLVGAIVGALIYVKKNKLDFFQWADILTISVPFGYAFGRLGNFINGELWGKVSAAPWAMFFPDAQRLSINLPWVRDMMEKLSIPAGQAMVNLPRHPSQLYELIFEGIVLGLIMWFIIRPRPVFSGFASSVYIMGYGLFRFFIEYFREPDADLGYLIKLGDPDASIHLYTTPWNFSMGQILCALMILGGAALMFFCWRKSRVKTPAALLE